MRKFLPLMIIAVLIMGIGGVLINRVFNHAEDEMKHEVLEAKTPYFETLEEMEEFSDVIIKGVRMDEEEGITTVVNGHVVSGYTMSKLEVTEVYKGESDTLKKGSKITILENEVEYEPQNVVYHVAGYKMMEVGKEYLLFLEKANKNQTEYYVAAGVNFGTVALETGNTKARIMDGDEHYYEALWEAAREKYK